MALKHGALHNGALFKKLGVMPTALDRAAQTRRIQRWRPVDGQNPRRRAHDGLPADAAWVQALAKGVPSADVVINLLAR
jgi:hypothetical protein